MTEASTPEWCVRIGRPAFQDFHLILPRYYSRSELIRQLLKLKWWDPNCPVVIDLPWKPIPETDLYELSIDEGFGFTSGLRMVFFEYSPPESKPCLWVLGGMLRNEAVNDFITSIYEGRSAIIKERATHLGEKENDTRT